MKVDFFIIGAPKCGTTAMAQYLRENESICFSSPKELNFFCQEEFPLDIFPSSTDEYHKKYFSHYDESVHKCVGEGSAYYLNSKHAVSRILDYNPDAKFIVMCRNPVQMVESWHREILRWFIEDEEDFMTAWNLQDSRREGKHMPVNCRQPSALQYKKVCCVGSHVERLLSIVDKRQVHFIFFEDFVSDTARIYASTCDFLGVEPGIRNEFPALHMARVWRNRTLRKIYQTAFTAKVAILGRKPLPGRIDAKAKKVLGVFVEPKEKIYDRNIDHMLRTEFAEDITLLSRLTGKDLTLWQEYDKTKA